MDWGTDVALFKTLLPLPSPSLPYEVMTEVSLGPVDGVKRGSIGTSISRN